MLDRQKATEIAARFSTVGSCCSCYGLPCNACNFTARFFLQVIPKAHLQQIKENQQRLQQQLSVQQALQHDHVVRLLGSFEDGNNIYVLMEQCSEWPWLTSHQQCCRQLTWACCKQQLNDIRCRCQGGPVIFCWQYLAVMGMFTFVPAPASENACKHVQSSRECAALYMIGMGIEHCAY